MNFWPKHALSDFTFKIEDGWLESIQKSEIPMCSAMLAYSIRSRHQGAKVYRIFVLGKALLRYLQEQNWPTPRFWPLNWLREFLRPFFKEDDNFDFVWQTAVSWGLVEENQELNACFFPDPTNSNSWKKAFNLLEIKPEDTWKRGSTADIIWTTHTAISARIELLYRREWSQTTETASRAAIFMQALNANQYEISLSTFAKIFKICERTLIRWSARSGEFSQRRCVPVVGSEWVPEWPKDQRPQHLQQIEKPIPNPKNPNFKRSLDLLNQTRKWSDNGHRTPYFFYYHKGRKAFILARRIPNVHKQRGGQDPIRVFPIPSESWVPNRNRYARSQIVQEPTEEDRIWWKPRKLAEFRRWAISDRQKAQYLSLSETEKADFRERWRASVNGEFGPMAMRVYDEILQDYYFEYLPHKSFKDKGSWAESKDRANLLLEYVRSLGSNKAKQAEIEQQLMSTADDSQSDWPMRDDDESERKLDESAGVRRRQKRMWKQSSLSGADGKLRFGVNAFTAPVYTVSSRVRAEWTRLMPERNQIVKWARVYCLGHKQIKPKKNSIRCTACHLKISHLPHPAYHTSCPRCRSVFAGVTGLALT